MTFWDFAHEHPLTVLIISLSFFWVTERTIKVIVRRRTREGEG